MFCPCFVVGATFDLCVKTGREHVFLFFLISAQLNGRNKGPLQAYTRLDTGTSNAMFYFADLLGDRFVMLVLETLWLPINLVCHQSTFLQLPFAIVMGMLLFVLLGLWPLQAFAGWSNGKGSSWRRQGPWFQGRSHGYYQSEGKGGTLNDAATLLASVLEKTAGRRKSRRDRFSSRSRSPSYHRRKSSRRSHSPSDGKEFQELRLYKEQAEASKKAAQEAERQLQEKMRREQELKDLEEKMMRVLPMHFGTPKKEKKKPEKQQKIPKFPVWA